MVPASDVEYLRVVQQAASDDSKIEHCIAGGRPFGITNRAGDADLGLPVQVYTGGIIPVVAGAPIAKKCRVASDATGKIVPMTHEHAWSAGYAITTGDTDHRVSIFFDPQPNTGGADLGSAYRSITIPIGYADGTAETDSGIDLPATSSLLPQVLLEVQTPEVTGATKTLDIGTLSGEAGGDADGIAAGLDVSSAGLVKATLASGGQTLGALLRVDESGSGALVPEANPSLGGRSISWTPGSADWAEFAGRIHLTAIVIGG
jgi:hypothetical protein